MTKKNASDKAVAAKPASLNNPIRRRVKRAGKKITRWMAGHQSRVSLVPDEPFLDPALFPFMDEIVERWRDIAEETQ